jgi:cell wall-associated NlpC family hydrolase
VAATTATVLAGAAPAAADPLADARARAAALTATVDRLQTAAEVAIERYDAVESQLGTAVIRQALAERQVESDQQTAQSASDQIAAHVRALYESGGRANLLATVLAGTDPADAISRLHTVGSVLSFDSAGMAAAVTTARQAGRLAASLTVAASRVTQLQHAAAAAASRIHGLLDAQQSALAAATSQVRTLVSERQTALAAASAQAFRDALASAGGSFATGSFSTGTAPPNAVAAGAISAAKSRLGDAYVWGATGPSTFDCSGLTQWSYAHVGISLPRVAADQWGSGPHVTLDSLEPGDLLFWATDLSNPATIHHVAMYLGAGMMIAAPHTGDVVKIQPVYLSGYIGATRPYSTTG